MRQLLIPGGCVSNLIPLVQIQFWEHSLEEWFVSSYLGMSRLLYAFIFPSLFLVYCTNIYCILITFGELGATGCMKLREKVKYCIVHNMHSIISKGVYCSRV